MRPRRTACTRCAAPWPSFDRHPSALHSKFIPTLWIAFSRPVPARAWQSPTVRPSCVPLNTCGQCRGAARWSCAIMIRALLSDIRRPQTPTLCHFSRTSLSHRFWLTQFSMWTEGRWARWIRYSEMCACFLGASTAWWLDFTVTDPHHIPPTLLTEQQRTTLFILFPHFPTWLGFNFTVLHPSICSACSWWLVETSFKLETRTFQNLPWISRPARVLHVHTHRSICSNFYRLCPNIMIHEVP